VTPAVPGRRGWLPRSVRGRLVATYTLAALLLALAGGLVFSMELRRGLHSGLDAGLDVQAGSLVAALHQAGEPDLPDPPAATAGGSSAAPPRSLLLVFRPDDRLVEAQPQRLPALPVTPVDLVEARVSPQRWTRDIAGVQVRLFAQPVTRPDGVWVVVAGASVESVEDAGDRVDQALLVLAPVLLVLLGVGAWLVSGAALRPVERMRAEAAELGTHDSAGRIGVPDTGDELAALATTWNELLDRLHRSASRQRDLVADAGHELRTPLAVLRTELELADRPARSRQELAEAVSHARGEVERLSRLAEDLLFLARVDGGTVLVSADAVDLSSVLEEAVRGWRASAAERSVALVLAAPARVPVTGDRAALRRAVDNLVSNALAATPAGGRVELDLQVEPEHPPGRSAPGWATLRIRDTGPGFPPEFLPHALERFRRADPSRSSASGPGSGLGLAITAEIAAAHAGRLVVGNAPGGGALATMTLPT